MMNKAAATTWILFLCVITFTAYAPGISGPFLFDDFPSLENLGDLGPIENLELARAFLYSGTAGPTGRPISLASFLLNANDWPADPIPFKITNILIHLLVGIVLFLTIRQLLRSIRWSATDADRAAVIASGLWLLNPLLVSTTLYVVQRMTQLATLFALLGMWGYLKGRQWLDQKPTLGYVTITVSLCGGTLLATFSKENGALLPLLILTIETTLRFHWATPGPSWRWRAVFLWLPSIAICLYLARYLPQLTQPIEFRDFNRLERMLTQARLLWDYLYHLLIPHIQTHGLYQDGIQLSTNLFHPWNTSLALLGISLLAFGAWIVRHRHPLISLAVLFFLAGHLLESTWLPLELYFEHRNYLPSVFLFLPIAAGIILLAQKRYRIAATAVIVLFFGSYTFATWQRAIIWGDEAQLLLVWAKTNPNSPRAQTAAAQTWLRLEQPDKAFAVLEDAMHRMPDSALIVSNYLSFRIAFSTLSAEELDQGTSRLLTQAFDPQLLISLRHLVEWINVHAPMPEHQKVMQRFLTQMRERLDGKVPVAHRFSYYLQGLLSSGQGNGDAAYQFLTESLKHYDSVETGLHMVSLLATHHHYLEAIKILRQTEKILERKGASELKRNRGTYLFEIARLDKELHIDAQAH